MGDKIQIEQLKKNKSHLTTINKRSNECIVLFLSPVLLSETGEF